MSSEMSKINPIDGQIKNLAARFIGMCLAIDKSTVGLLESKATTLKTPERMEMKNQLLEFISSNYKGTEHGKKRLLKRIKEAFISERFGVESLISELLIDVDNDDYGVFTKEGSREFERADLVFGATQDIEVSLDNFGSGEQIEFLHPDPVLREKISAAFDIPPVAIIEPPIEGQVHSAIVDFLSQIEEYKEHFEEDYDVENSNPVIPSEHLAHTRRVKARAQEFIGSLRKS